MNRRKWLDDETEAEPVRRLKTDRTTVVILSAFFGGVAGAIVLAVVGFVVAVSSPVIGDRADMRADPQTGTVLHVMLFGAIGTLPGAGLGLLGAIAMGQRSR